MSEAKPVVLSCAQPTGVLHLGNYLGAVKNWATMLDENECYFGIVDMHAITVPHVPADLRRDTMSCVAQYIACGLDPEKASIFIQSHVVGHSELAWVLGCLCPLGRLERMTQFKDKSKNKGESVGTGLLTYPILMAADILLYNADVVPVGEDQKQHLELTRDLAGSFNHTYSDTFKIPEPFIGKSGARIMSLQSPESKMSKSDANQSGSLYILDDEKTLRKKIGSAVTDSEGSIRATDEKPGVKNLLTIMSACTDKPIAELEKEFDGQGYAAFKGTVADAVVQTVEPVRTKYHELMADKKYLQSVLKSGADGAQKRAYKTLAKVYKKTGFVERVR